MNRTRRSKDSSMFVGTKGRFGIGSQIMTAFHRKGARALGNFVVHIHDQKYGVEDPDASMLAWAFDEVERRLARRGGHVSPLVGWGAATLSAALYAAFYGEEEDNRAPTSLSPEAVATVRGNGIQWAPGGDEEFDDGSHIYQFDRDRDVRLIAFRSAPGHLQIEEGSLRDLTLDADEFYSVLEEWRRRFIDEWRSLPKAD